MPLPVPKKPPSPSPSSTSRLIVCLLLAVLHQSDQPLPAGCPLEAQLSHLVSHPALCGPLCCPPPPASSSHQRRRPRPPLRPDCLLNHPVSRTGSSAGPPPWRRFHDSVATNHRCNRPFFHLLSLRAIAAPHTLSLSPTLPISASLLGHLTREKVCACSQADVAGLRHRPFASCNLLAAGSAFLQSSRVNAV